MPSTSDPFIPSNDQMCLKRRPSYTIPTSINLPIMTSVTDSKITKSRIIKMYKKILKICWRTLWCPELYSDFNAHTAHTHSRRYTSDFHTATIQIYKLVLLHHYGLYPGTVHVSVKCSHRVRLQFTSASGGNYLPARCFLRGPGARLGL